MIPKRTYTLPNLEKVNSLTDDQKKFINFNAAIFKTLSDFEKLYKDVEPKNGEYEIHTNFDGTVTIIIPSIK